MIKKILLLLFVLVIAGLAAVYFFGSSALNNAIKHGVETFGPEITQTSVTLESVNLSVLSGSGTLKGLNIGNPEGFKSENIFALGEITVDIDPGSLMSDTIVINRLHILQPEISYEKTLSSSNVQELLKNIESFTGSGSEKTEEAPEESEGATKSVVIKELLIDEGKIYVGALGVGQTVPLSKIEMSNIGEDGKTISMAEVMDIILSQVTNSIGPAIANAGVLLQDGGKAALNTIKEQGLDNVTEGANEAVNQATESIKGLFGK
ncbi:MAG: hypothetical protein AAGH40_10695 [Verrucomicrobiota bacterium]